MNILALSLLSAILYSFGTAHQAMIYLRKRPARPFITLLLGIVAVVAQLTSTLNLIISEDSLHFGFFNTASLTAGLIVICLLVLSTRKPLHTIFLAVYPIAVFTIAGTLIFDGSDYTFNPDTDGILAHIGLSILAYSVFSIAAIQAILIYIQNNNLKKKHHTILMRNLPPLLTMENLLFEMLWAGTVILALAIAAGFVFVDDLFAQHLAHKTFFSLVSLGVFSTLLAGRKLYGWRGLTASKLTLWGVGLLMIGFFGSKLVLEWLVTP